MRIARASTWRDEMNVFAEITLRALHYRSHNKKLQIRTIWNRNETDTDECVAALAKSFFGTHNMYWIAELMTRESIVEILAYVRLNLGLRPCCLAPTAVILQ